MTQVGARRRPERDESWSDISPQLERHEVKPRKTWKVWLLAMVADNVMAPT
jgi:hypothetical protein